MREGMRRVGFGWELGGREYAANFSNVVCSFYWSVTIGGKLEGDSTSRSRETVTIVRASDDVGDFTDHGERDSVMQ